MGSIALASSRDKTDDDIKVLLDHKKKSDVGRYNKAGEAYRQANLGVISSAPRATILVEGLNW